jgi:hypothetical protein
MEAAGGEAMPDRLWPEPELEQLRASNYAVLAGGERPNGPVMD